LVRQITPEILKNYLLKKVYIMIKSKKQ